MQSSTQESKETKKEQASKQKQPSQNLLVLALDFDGCIFNNFYLKRENYRTYKNVIAANEKLISEMVSKIKRGNELGKFDKVLGTFFTCRQDARRDFNCGFKNDTASCFPTLGIIITEICKRAGIENFDVDPYLLSDTYNNFKAGTCFNRAVSAIKYINYGKYVDALPPDWLFDETKSSILLAQTARLAVEHSSAKKITYVAIDDDGTDRIFPHLLNFSKSKMDAFVSNKMKVEFFKYDGKSFKEAGDFVGKACLPDYDYEKNLIKFAKNVLQCEFKDIKLSSHITFQKIKNFNFDDYVKSAANEYKVVCQFTGDVEIPLKISIVPKNSSSHLHNSIFVNKESNSSTDVAISQPYKGTSYPM